MDAPKKNNPYLGLSQQKLDGKLYFTAWEGNKLAKLVLLIEAGANLNATDMSGKNVLSCAVGRNNNANMVNLLLNAAKQKDIDFFNNNNTRDLDAFLENEDSNYNGNIYYRLLSERSDEQLKAVVNKGYRISGFIKELNENKMKVHQLVMPFLLKIDHTHGFDTLPPELLGLISGLVSQLQGDKSFPEWYQHRIERDAREICKFVACSNEKTVSHYYLPQTEAPSPIVTPLHDAKKRKAEEELEENGRNKRLRPNGQDEQDMNVDSGYFSFMGDCSVQ